MTNASKAVRRLIALPGMDGTGKLLEAFAEAVGPRLDTRIIGYPRESFAYDALTERVAAELAGETEDFALLAESFSGPIAIRLAHRGIPGLRALILVVTFGPRPRHPLWPLTSLIPLEKMMGYDVPCWVACQGFLHTDAPAKAREAFCEVITKVSPGAITRRMAEVRNLDPPESTIAQPVLYIQAENDRVLPASALDDLRPWAPDLEVFRTPGPHLVLSAQPKACADRVVSFLGNLSSHRRR